MTDTVTDLHEEWTGRLSELLDDELSPAERPEVEEHVRTCIGCRATLEQLRAVKTRASGLRDQDPGPHVWAGIAERIGAPGITLDVAGDELAARRARKQVRFPWLRSAIAAAAVLALGIGIGRMSNGPERLDTTVVQAPARGTSMTSDAYRVAVAQHLSRTETLLTSFRAEAAAGQVDASVADWAGQMLANTRLLLDSPAANDPMLRTLLEDLELVLAQIASLPHRTELSKTEVEMARRAMEEKQLLPRMQTLAPAASPATLGES
ncbi:MAG: zf-HC2 domain-containing protein [Gemmatimonadetes bacterium]|nr:zf-HC2 domain-containing protein [Gemmatimonadota bacterium]